QDLELVVDRQEIADDVLELEIVDGSGAPVPRVARGRLVGPAPVPLQFEGVGRISVHPVPPATYTLELRVEGCPLWVQPLDLAADRPRDPVVIRVGAPPAAVVHHPDATGGAAASLRILVAAVGDRAWSQTVA